jgi:hypothetical protein
MDIAETEMGIADWCRNAGKPNKYRTFHRGEEAADTIEALHETLKKLLANHDEETGTIDVSPQASCLECTLGTTPVQFDKGLCVFHEAQHIIKQGEA